MNLISNTFLQLFCRTNICLIKQPGFQKYIIMELVSGYLWQLLFILTNLSLYILPMFIPEILFKKKTKVYPNQLVFVFKKC